MMAPQFPSRHVCHTCLDGKGVRWILQGSTKTLSLGKGQSPLYVLMQIDLVKGMTDCLYAQCTPCITDCVMAELEKLGQKYRVALKIAKDPRVRKLPCTHKGTYADDCICERVTQHRCYIVATCDKDLRRRLRKVWFQPLHCGTEMCLRHTVIVLGLVASPGVKHTIGINSCTDHQDSFGMLPIECCTDAHESAASADTWSPCHVLTKSPLHHREAS